MSRKTLAGVQGRRHGLGWREWRAAGAAGYVRGVSLSDEPTAREPLPATTLFCAGLARAGAGETVSLDPDEFAHARALRIATGDAVLVTDGRGLRWEAELTETGRRTVACRLRAPRPAAAPRPLILWAPVGNRDRSLWLVEKAVELGVRRVVLTECARSRSVADAGRSAGFLDKARRRAIAALTQSGGAHLPELSGPRDLDELLDAPPEPEAAVRLVADPEGRPALDVVRARTPEAAIWLVGPEGGLTPEERRRARTAGFEMVALGARTLRFETAAVAGLAILAAGLDAAAGANARDGERASPGSGPEPATSPDGGRSAAWSGES